MRAEYLLFDLLVLLPPLALSYSRGASLRGRHLLGWACALGSLPFIVWDALVTGRHWTFDPRHTLGLTVLGLPVEELLFFLAVPFACIFMWEKVFRGEQSRTRSTRLGYVLSAGLSTLGLAVLFTGREYTGIVLVALGAVGALDHALGTGLLTRPRWYAFLLVVCGLNLVFNGYLTGRPIVHYDPRYITGVRIGPVPIEDLAYGVALVTSVGAAYHWLDRRRPFPSWLSRAIEWRLGGYRQQLVLESPAKAWSHPPRSIAIIGGGLAGLTTAVLLGERGFRVTIFERNDYLGGKLGAWRETTESGEIIEVEHGFHAFFRHYYNLQRFLERLHLSRSLAPIGEYVILGRDGRTFHFPERRVAPALNLLGLAREGVYDLREVASGGTGRKLEAFLRYDPDRTFEDWDRVPFRTFADSAELPPALRTIFTTFARAFFATPDRISTAQLIASFHFYYLSHDLGLAYDYMRQGIREGLLEPLEAHLCRCGVEVRRRQSVERIDALPDKRLGIAGREFDAVVLAADVAAARRMVLASPFLRDADPELVSRMSALRSGQRYAVLRVWLDLPSRVDLPVFVATERFELLDAVAFVDRMETSCRAWAESEGGSVLELHCYAIPDGTHDAEIENALMRDLGRHIPSLRAARVMRRSMQLRDDFTAFHPGMHGQRPGTTTAVQGLLLAGDWVRLPCPAMLMEAAHVSGILAANAVLREAGFSEELVETVPLRGLMAHRSASRPTRTRSEPTHALESGGRARWTG